MKIYFVKASLLLIVLVGTVFGLSIYNQILLVIGRVFNFRYYWLFIPVIFAVSLLILRLLIRNLAKDLVATNTFGELSLPVALKFFVGGVIGCYAAFATVGTIIWIFYLVFSFFLL